MSMEDSQVKLHGFWVSPSVHRVIWALKLKGIEYEYIEEDLSSKSPSLLQYNPIHQKVPVLVHNGRPVAESSIIIQYIEETWPDTQNPLLPLDPYERSVARFWINFVEQKMNIFFEFFRAVEEEEKDRVAKQLVEIFKVVEEKGLGDKKFFGGDRIGLVDLSFGWLVDPWFECLQQLIGRQVYDPNTLPKLHQWTIDFRNEPIIKDNVPDKMRVYAHYEKLRNIITSPTNN